MNIYIKLFFAFFKIGLFSIGGGLATLPLLQEAINKYNWMSSETFIDMIAISQSTPGPIGINMATYVGYEVGNLYGAVTATIAIVIPSLVIIIIIAHYFSKFKENKYVKYGFYALRPAVTGLIATACYEIAKVSLFNFDNDDFKKSFIDVFNIKAIIFFIFIFILLNKYKKHPIFYLVLAGCVSAII